MYLQNAKLSFDKKNFLFVAVLGSFNLKHKKTCLNKKTALSLSETLKNKDVDTNQFIHIAPFKSRWPKVLHSRRLNAWEEMQIES